MASDEGSQDESDEVLTNVTTDDDGGKWPTIFDDEVTRQEVAHPHPDNVYSVAGVPSKSRSSGARKERVVHGRSGSGAHVGLFPQTFDKTLNPTHFV